MVVAFYISINALQAVNFQTESLEGIIHEFKSGYIDNIIVLRDATTCPKNYTPLIKNFNWPGNHKGCGCKTDNINLNYQFFKNNCPSNKDCIKVEETQDVLINKWKGSLICYRRNKQIYDNLNIMSKTDMNQCNLQTQQICGRIDAKDNILCLDKSAACPLTEIKFIDAKELPQFFINKNITNYEKMIIYSNSSSSIQMIKQENQSFEYLYELMDQTYLYISNLPTNSVTADLINFFRIDITAPCLNHLKSPSSEFFFPLMKNKFDLMCDKFENGTELTDSTFSPIDSYLLEEYYRENNVLEMIKHVIDPFSIDTLSENINIYARTYPGWSYTCEDSNPNALHSFTTTAEVMNSMLISLIIHSFISIALIISIGVFSCFLPKYFELLFKAVDLAFILINLFYPIQIISTCNWVINLLTDEDGLYCGDSSLNIILSEISNACLQLEYAYIMILLLALFSCVVFIYVLYNWVRPATKEVNETLISLTNK